MERKARNCTGVGTRGSLERKCFRAVSQLVAQCQVYTNNTVIEMTTVLCLCQVLFQTPHSFDPLQENEVLLLTPFHR